MVCYSDKIKSLAAKVVAVVSGIIILMGLLTAYFGAIQTGVVQKPNEWSGVSAFDQSGLGKVVLMFGAFVILVGLLGCATCKCKKACFTIPFVIFTMIFGIILVGGGLVVVSVGGELGETFEKAQKATCDS
jgi:hypothetical protein